MLLVKRTVEKANKENREGAAKDRCRDARILYVTQCGR